jgi:hypothetical protein
VRQGFAAWGGIKAGAVSTVPPHGGWAGGSPMCWRPVTPSLTEWPPVARKPLTPVLQTLSREGQRQMAPHQAPLVVQGGVQGAVQGSQLGGARTAGRGPGGRRGASAFRSSWLARALGRRRCCNHTQCQRLEALACLECQLPPPQPPMSLVLAPERGSAVPPRAIPQTAPRLPRLPPTHAPTAAFKEPRPFRSPARTDTALSPPPTRARACGRTAAAPPPPPG